VWAYKMAPLVWGFANLQGWAENKDGKRERAPSRNQSHCLV